MAQTKKKKNIGGKKSKLIKAKTDKILAQKHIDPSQVVSAVVDHEHEIAHVGKYNEENQAQIAAQEILNE